MSMSEDIERLDSELEQEKRALREDMELIKTEVEAARESISPRGIFARWPLLITGLAALAGFILGYRGAEIVEASKPALQSAARPAAKAALTTAATQAVMRAVRGT